MGNFEIHELYKSTLNDPIMVCWPKAMKYYRREDFMRDMYPKAARVKKFGIESHKDQFRRALKFADKANIINTRLDLMQFIRSFGGEAREIWR